MVEITELIDWIEKKIKPEQIIKLVQISSSAIEFKDNILDICTTPKKYNNVNWKLAWIYFNSDD